MDFMANCWVNLQILGQPCEFDLDSCCFADAPPELTLPEFMKPSA
jgi:hypothetical protein